MHTQLTYIAAKLEAADRQRGASSVRQARDLPVSSTRSLIPRLILKRLATASESAAAQLVATAGELLR
jgi:hypothetical protein